MTFSDKGHSKDHHDIALKALTTLLEKTSSELDESIVYLDQFKRAVEEASIFSTADADGIITDVNPNFEAVSGYRRGELVGAPFSLLRMPQVPKALFEEMWETIRSGRTWKGLLKNRHKDGSTYHVITLVVPILHKDGSFKEYIAISNDVTELEEYKQLLKHELDTTSQNLQENLHYTEQYEAALNRTVSIVKTDAEGTIIYANGAFCDLSGYNTQELTGRNSREILCPSLSAGASDFRPEGDQPVNKVLTN
ncbi:MAG: PAS domain S-box protein, partial [Campylobacterales bacterium]